MTAAAVPGSAVPAVTAVAMVLLAVAIDASAAGPDRIRDRVAGVLAICGLYALYDGTETASTVRDVAVTAVQSATDALGGRWSDVSAGALLTLIAGLAAVGVLMAFLPDEGGQGRGGQGKGWQALAARISLRPRQVRRINWRIWAAAAVMAVFAPLAQGLIGAGVDAALSFLPSLLSGAVAALFGLPA